MSTLSNRVVVGYEASKEAEFALQWAASVAERRNVPLTVVHATDLERPSPQLARAGMLEIYEQRAWEVAEEGAKRARALTSMPVDHVGIQSGAAAALVDLSAQASLVVVGHRTRGVLSETLLGSVALTVATHAACPVAVVRHSTAPLPSMGNPIVVGVDGSAHSARALDEAAFLADSAQSLLRIVVAWRQPKQRPWSSIISHRSESSAGGVATSAKESTPLQSGGMEAAVYHQLVTDLKQRAFETAQWATKHAHKNFPNLKVEQVISEGSAAQAILTAATGASMIAVGTRGHGDLETLLLGSVSRKVMNQAECAVYVIR